MKIKTVSEADAKKIKKTPGGGGARAASRARRKAYYSALPSVTLKNLQLSRARHLRNYPGDIFAREAYAKLYGKGALDSPLCKVKARMARKHVQKTKRAGRHQAMTSEALPT
jgi:hypothetical protein